MKKLIHLPLVIILLSFLTSGFLMSDQGTNVRDSNGSLLSQGNLTISIYDLPSAGNLIFSTTIQAAIANGSWNLMINPSLDYGRIYWKDYGINGEDLDFDGNERLEFQTLGYINNVSFINLSLIGSCPSGSSIRLIYSNGSVDCETISGSNITIDLSNYALKNQSETFAGNITTSYSGLFGFLGSLTNRITKLFVHDIDSSGNVNVSGNVTSSYFKGDGSLLTNLPVGSESDPIFVSQNSSLWSAITSKLNYSDQRYNDTLLILSVNTSSNIMSLGFYNITQVNALLSNTGNSSFNQSLTNNLYYSISNPNNFLNATSGSFFNDTSLILITNSSLWSYINSNQIFWNSSYNSTYNRLLGQQCSTGAVVNGTLINGTFTCLTIPSSSGNIFDQVLNRSSNVTFANLSSSNGFFSFLGSALSRINKIFVSDVDISNNLTVAGNISGQFYFGSLNSSTFPTSSCSGTDKVVGINASGVVNCGVDQSSSSSSTIPVKFMNVVAGAVTDTNAPAAERIIGNSYYLVCTNTTGYTRFRYGYARATTNGASGAIVYMKYIGAPSNTITGASYLNLSNSTYQLLSYTAQNSANLSEYYSMNSNLGDICIGAFQSGGDGVADPQWRNIWIELS